MNDRYITFSALVPLHGLSFLSYKVSVRLWSDPKVLGAFGLGAGPQRSLVVVWIWVRCGLCFPSPTSLRALCLRARYVFQVSQVSQVGLEELEG